MTIEARQIRDNIIKPVLGELGMWSPGAETLLWGTAAHEGDGFNALRQYGNGPALSWWGIEPDTYRDLLTNTIPGLQRSHPKAIAAYQGMVPKRYAGYAPAEHLMRDQAYACATARLLYWRIAAPLPAADDLPGLAAYWKRYYNTEHGAGRAEQWLDAYRRFCQ